MAADLAGPHQKPIGADKNCVTRGFVAEMRRIGFTPHVAQNRSCPGSSRLIATSATPNRSMPAGDRQVVWLDLTQSSPQEYAFGGLRQFKVCGTDKVAAVFRLQVITYNLIRLGNLLKPAMAAA